MITDIIDGNAAKVISLFSLSPGSKFTRNEIQGKTRMNNIPLDNALSLLMRNKILEKEKRIIFLNHKDKHAKTLISILKEEFERFKELPLAVYYLLMDASHKLSTLSNIEQAYLFGSYAKLVHTEKSDVDLAIIVSKKNNKTAQQVKSLIKKLEKKYGKTVEGHFFEKKELKQNDPLIKEVLRNNVPLF